MKRFAYLQAESYSAASKALAQAKSAVAKGAGTDLLDLLKSRIVEPDEVVSLLPIKDDEKKGEIAALATLHDVATDEWVKLEFPALHTAAGTAATPQIRHTGTLGGNLAQVSRCWFLRTPGHACVKLGDATCAAAGKLAENRYHGLFESNGCHCAHPSNLAPALIAVGAQASCVHPDGNRTMDVELLYDAVKKGRMSDLSLRPGELIRSVVLHASPLARNSVYLEFRERHSFDFALASVAAAAELDGGKVKDIRIVCGGVAPTPYRARDAETLLKGKRLDPEAAAAAVVKGAVPLSMNRFKVTILKELVRRALKEIAS
ncbi:MAG: FAD binding domain-containing protein [Planctomycetota bacterium]|jgi:xanthine dehydrogenase YagS FAD-binding subunit